METNTMRSIAADAARKVARNYPGVDADDIEQSILLKWLERSMLLNGERYTTGALYTLCVKWGTEYANDERITHYHFSNQYHYTAKEIRKLCSEALFDTEAFMRRLEAGDQELASDPEEVIARVLDLQEAFSYLSERRKELLTRRYVNDEPLNASDRKELQRTIDRLVLSVNVSRSARRSAPKDHNGPGARVAISNAEARNITRNNLNA